jgi:peptide/nickel transport system substrate-binding protein
MNMSMYFRKSLILGVVFTIVFFAAGCSTAATPAIPETEAPPEQTEAPPEETEALPEETEALPEQTEEPQAEPTEPETKEINIGPNFDAKGLSPDLTNFWTVFGVVENLTTLDPEGDLVPALAIEWEMTGNETWDFTLREGVQFHNGQPLNADAVASALNRYIGLESARTELQGATITAIDEYTIEITTQKHEPYLPQLMTDYTMGIMAPEAFDGDGNPVEVIGTGPFVLVEWIQDEHATLMKFDDYWGDSPKVDRINLLRIPDPHTRATMIRTGELDIAEGMPVTDAISLAGESDIDVFEVPQTRYRVIYLNNSAPPFDDVRIRKAINYAIDRDALVEYILEGYGSVAQSPFLPTLPWGTNEIEGYSYDPDTAKALLEEAGAENLTFSLCTYTSRAELPLLAQAIQAQLAEIGVTAELEVGEYSACQKSVSDGTHEAVLIARGPLYGGYDPMTLYASDYACDGGYNWSSYCDPEFEALLSEAQVVDDLSKRYELSQDMEQFLVDKAVDVFLNYYVGIDATRSDVTGYIPHPLEMGSPLQLVDKR